MSSGVVGICLGETGRVGDLWLVMRRWGTTAGSTWWRLSCSSEVWGGVCCEGSTGTVGDLVLAMDVLRQ